MSILPSQGLPPINESALPPMPRRQSCDRCHEQKVRCVTDGYGNDTSGLEVMGEESEASRGRSVVAPIPCVRCSKAGAVCIFSPQLRSGRPRVHRHPTRKRARRSSKCSSSPAELSPTHSQSLSPRPSSFNFSASKTIRDFEKQSHSEAIPLLLSTSLPPSFEGSHSTQRGANLGTPVTLVSDFGLPIDQDQFSVRHDHFQSFSHSIEGSSAGFMPSFADKVLSATATTTDNGWIYSGSSEGYLEEVTQINLRIHSAGLMLCPLARTLLTIASPAISEIFDAACSLISFADRYGTRQIKPPLDKRRAGSDGYQASSVIMGEPAFISSAADISIRLIALASHQLLLGIFEDLCASFLSQIERARPTTPPSMPSTGAFFGSSHSQMLEMASLISHLMEQLDHTLQLLADQQDRSESPEGLTVAAAMASTHDSEFDHVLGFGHPPEASQPSHIPSLCGQDHKRRAPSSHQGGVVSIIFGEVEQRQVRAREQLMTLRDLLGQDGV